MGGLSESGNHHQMRNLGAIDGANLTPYALNPPRAPGCRWVPPLRHQSCNPLLSMFRHLACIYAGQLTIADNPVTLDQQVAHLKGTT